MLQISQVEKSYPSFKLGPLNLEVPEGYIMGLVGENGAGKSTLIYLIMSLLRPEDGQVKVFGQTYEEAEVAIKSQIGFVYEDNVFYDNLKPRAMAKILRMSYPNWNQAEYDRLIKRFGISEKPLGKLSKGQRMIYHIITALSHEAKLLILDEPTAGLDPIVRREILEELKNYVATGERSILFSTHITTDLEQTADLITFIHCGRVIFSQDVEQLREDYHLVKGSAQTMDQIKLLGKQVRNTHVIGLYQGPVADLSNVKVEIEPASLEDIMFYLKRGQDD